MKQQATETKKTQRKVLNLNASAPKAGSGFEIPMPNGWNRAKDLISTTKEKATEKVRTIHRTSTRKSAEQAFQTAERISAETTGFVSGLIRKTVGTVSGAVAGVFAGTRGVSPSVLNRLRMGGGELVLLGNWTRIRSRKNEASVVEMNLTHDLALNPIESGTVSTLALISGSKAAVQIGEEEVKATLIPITETDTLETTGFIVLAEDKTKAVYRWVDAD